MLLFKNLRVRGIPFFKKQDFRLDTPGISLVLGCNHDAGGGGNAAGKSLLMSQVPELCLLESLNEIRRDKTRRGSRVLELERNGVSYEVEQTFSPRESLIIRKDGVDQDYHTLAEASAALSKIIGYNRQEILSFVYLDSRMPHPLIAGDTTERKKFFTHFFRLHAGQAAKKLVNDEITGLGKDAAVLRELESQLASLSSVGVEDKQVLEVKVEKLRAKLVLLSKKAKRKSEVETIVSTYKQHASSIKQLLAEGVGDLETANTYSDKLEVKLATLRKKLDAALKYEDYVSGATESKKRLKEVVSLLKGSEFTQITDLESASEYVTITTTKIDSLSEDIEKITAYKKKHLRDAKELSESIAHAEESITKHSEAADTCPTCGADYNNKHAKSEIRKLKTSVVEMSASLLNANKEASTYSGMLEKLILRVDQLTAKLDSAKGVLKLWKEHSRLTSSVSVEDPGYTSDSVSVKIQAVKLFQELLSARRTIYTSVDQYAGLTDADHQLLELTDLDDKVEATNESLSETKVELSRIESAEKQRELLEERIGVLTEKLSELPAVELLQKAFAKNGVDAMMIKALCSRLEAQVNKYASLLFPEDYHFSFELEVQFSILVTRRYKGREETSDVRKLSGAESRMFGFLLLLSLMVFIPEDKRSSMLVLDEPENALSPESMERFTSFLPVLSKIIPSIFIITPQDPSLYQSLNPTVFTVVKKNGISKVVNGHVT